MTTPAIDPSQTRAGPAPDKGVPGKTALAAFQVALGAAGLAGVAAGAIWLVSESEPPPRSEVRLAAVKDWPEIKNGVPNLAPAQATTPVVAPVAAQPAHAVGAPAPPAEAQAAAASPESAVVAPEPSPETGPGLTDSLDVEPADAAPPPLPPPAPRRTTQDKAKPRKEPSARSQPQRTAAARPNPAAKPEADPPPKEAAPDDRIRVFGVPLPTGRDIKETFESLGNAVMGRPNRS